MAIEPAYVFIGVVSVAILAMFSINLYLMLKSRKKEDPNQGHIVALHGRLDAFADLLNKQLQDNRQQLEQNRQTSQHATLSVAQQVQGFTQGMTQLHENIKSVHESMKSVVSFQDIFKSPKLRGMWGEQSLENSLGQYFPKDMYEMQHYFKSGEAVDAVIKLPNGLLLPIDAKFNWDNFVKLIEAEDEISKDNFRKQFLSDVKSKVDEISNKYILPGENTTEYAMMYVPAEAVYYELINNVKGVDIPAYARSKRVGIMSPNTFYLTTASILHWFKNIEFNKQTRDIMKRLDRIATDGKKLGDEFSRLGKHLSNATSTYNDTEKRLSLIVDRVERVVEMGQGEGSSGGITSAEPEKLEAPIE